MFGRSTSSRFGKESKEYTPGPGEYDAKHVATTSKRGASMGIGARSLVTGTSEFAHLGPGAYILSGESSFADGRRGTLLPRTTTVDFDAAMKKLGTSLAKVIGNTTAGVSTQHQKDFNRDDICAMASKLVGEALAASSDAMRLKGELDNINSRVKDEVQAALKPSKSSGNSGNPAAWKLYMPLEKAVDNASSDLAKKLGKLSLFLTTLHDDFPALMVTMADGDRIGQLSLSIETLQTDLDEAIRQAADASDVATAAESAKAALEREYAACRRQLLQHQTRADQLEELIASQGKIMESLEDQLEASHARNDEIWVQLGPAQPQPQQDARARALAPREDGDGSEQQCQDLLDECKQARESQEQTLQELHALQAQMTHLMADAALREVSMEERLQREADVASGAADDLLSDLDECHALITQSYRDKRIIRTNVALLEAKQRAHRGCLEAGSAELARVHQAMADLESDPHCLPSPQRLRPEAMEAVAQLDTSATQDVLAGLDREEEMRAALQECQDMLAEATLELSRLQRESDSRMQESYAVESGLRATVHELMQRHADEEGALRAQVQQHAIQLDGAHRQLKEMSVQRDAHASQANHLESTLAQLQQEFSNWKETSRCKTEECQEMHSQQMQSMRTRVNQAQADLEHTRMQVEQLHADIERRERERDAQKEDLLGKARQVDEMAQELEQMASEHSALRACADAGLARLACALKESTKDKAQLQAQLCQAREETASMKAQSEKRMAQLEGEAARQCEEMAAARQAFATTRSQLHEQLEERSAAVDALSEANASLAADKASQAEEIAQCSNRVKALTSKLQETEEELAAACCARDACTLDFTAQRASLQERIAELNADIARMDREAQEQARQAADAQARLTDAEAQHQASCRQIGELESTLNDKISLLERTQEELEHSACQRSQLEARLAEKEDELRRSRSALEEAAGEKKNLGDLLSRAQDSLVAKGQEAQGLEDDLGQSRQELLDMTRERDTQAHQLQELRTTLEHARARAEEQAAVDARSYRMLEERLAAELSHAVQMHSDAVAAHALQLQSNEAHHVAALEDAQKQHAAAIDVMQQEHVQQLDDWQCKLNEAHALHSKQVGEIEESAREERRVAQLEHECALQQLKHQHEADLARSGQHADAVKTQLCDKLQEAEQRLQDVTSALQKQSEQLEDERAESKAAADEAARQLAAADSKIDLLGKALKGTEEEKAAALAAFSSMYQQTDEQLKAMAAGAGSALHADPAALSRIALLQAELETSMMERSECLQQLQQLQQSEREAAADALRHRERLEMAEAENKALSDRVQVLQADNAKLSAENVQLVGHSNLKQRINIFNNVKDENNALKKEKNEAERLVAQQKKVIERLQMQAGADKENACLFAKIDQEEKLQAALKESDAETRALRKHLLTLLHHVQTCAASTTLGPVLKVSAGVESDGGREVLCDNNKGLKQRDWCADVRETERIIDGLTTHLQQQEREVAGAQLKIHLLEQSARIIAPPSRV